MSQPLMHPVMLSYDELTLLTRSVRVSLGAYRRIVEGEPVPDLEEELERWDHNFTHVLSDEQHEKLTNKFTTAYSRLCSEGGTV